MGYSGLVPSEYTTGSRRRLGAITKTGNAHLRRVVIEAAWAYRFGPAVRGPLRARQVGLEPVITEIAWRAQSDCTTGIEHWSRRGRTTIR